MPSLVPARWFFPSPALRLALVTAFTALVFPFVTTAGVYRCTNAVGEVEYSDMACPLDVTKQELDIPAHNPNPGPAGGAGGRYSILDQVRMIDERHAAAAQKRAAREQEAEAQMASERAAKAREADAHERVPEENTFDRWMREREEARVAQAQEAQERSAAAYAAWLERLVHEADERRAQERAKKGGTPPGSLQ